MKTTVSIKIIFLSRSADQASEDLDNPNFTFDLGRGQHEKVLPVADVASSQKYIIMYFFIVILSYFNTSPFVILFGNYWRSALSPD